MTYCLYELSMNQDIQSKARKEIDDTLMKHGGQFTYEAMKEMHYINQIIEGIILSKLNFPLLPFSNDFHF